MTALAAVLALLIGLTLGLLGGGGSILTVPVIAYSMNVDPKLAVVMSLPIVGGASLVGVVRNLRMGNIDLRLAIPFGLAAMVGAFGGARAARFLSGEMQLLLLAVVMLGASVSMFRNAKLPEPAAGERPHLGAGVLVIGALTGVLTGLVGVGGGFLLVPAFVLLAGLPMRSAVGTSLFVIVLNTTAGYAGYHGVVSVPWNLVLWFAGFTAAGLLGGTYLVQHISQSLLKRAFAVLLVVVAGYIIYKNGGSL
ncbi:MAG: sulfite exporter TauE/SafE family protein [Gemmatimonadaceae bacterium]|nr:sulfite exporter TauE/SafE family protein [Gemmatimonadaceae bacterium]